MEELFANKEYCAKELNVARKIMTDGTSTRKDLETLISSLSFMYFHCPIDLTDLVLSNINEVSYRLAYKSLI